MIVVGVTQVEEPTEFNTLVPDRCVSRYKTVNTTSENTDTQFPQVPPFTLRD